MKLAHLEDSISIDASPERTWETLARYVDVGDFHTGVVSSRLIAGPTTGVGADRHCNLPGNVEVWERITAWEEGKSYSYDVYKWKKFPLKAMHTTFGVDPSSVPNRSILYQKLDYRLSPGFLTGLMKGRLRGAVRDTLLGYKHFIETGEPNVPLKKLRKLYKGVA